MNQDRQSEFKLYSLGIVTENKPLGTNVIKVTPIEVVTTTTGPLSNTASIGTHKGIAIHKSTTILATWVQDGQTNRTTAPNVYANETVKIYRYADTDQYYWNTIFDEPNIRRQEQVRYSYSNLKTPLTPYDSNSSYWIEWSTINKYVYLHTSDNDGELAKYDIKIDTKNGIISIIDNHGNTLNWNSPQKQLIIDMKDAIDLIATNTINVTAPTINIDASKVINATAPIISISASSVLNIDPPTINITATTNINITSPITNITGDAAISGNVKIGGNMDAGGAVNGTSGNCFNDTQ